MWEFSETVWKLAGSNLTPPFGKGITNASFGMDGIVPVERKHINRIYKGKARLIWHFLRRMEGTPSGPAQAPELS